MEDKNSIFRSNNNDSAISNKAIVISILFIFILVIIQIFWIPRWLARRRRRRREARSHSIVAASELSIPTVGLNPSILHSLPIPVYRSKDFKEGLECVICLSKIADREKVRLLPNCKHVFHLKCIDIWFHSHSTCPLCRRPVKGLDGLPRHKLVRKDACVKRWQL